MRMAPCMGGNVEVEYPPTVLCPLLIEAEKIPTRPDTLLIRDREYPYTPLG